MSEIYNADKVKYVQCDPLCIKEEYFFFDAFFYPRLQMTSGVVCTVLAAAPANDLWGGLQAKVPPGCK